jgi:hypothetical protein
MTVQLKVDRRFDKLRARPRFNALQSQVGLR